MPRLPHPGSDSGQWGTILNDYLSQTLNTDGTLRDGIVSSTNLAPDAVGESALAAGTGTDNYVLTYDSSLPSKLAWKASTATPSAIVAMGGDLSGNSDNAQLQAGVVTVTELADSAVTTAKLANTSITPTKLDSDTPAPGELLSYNGTTQTFEWVPAPSVSVADGSISAAKLNVPAGAVDGYVLTLDSNEAGGFKWQAVSTGSANPIGAAGGDLTGTYPNPSVAKLQGITISGTAPTANQVLMADSATAASWHDAPSAPVSSVAGKTGAVTLAKTDVGLGSVDNTSDLNKPISTATQTALNTKVNTTDLTESVQDVIGSTIKAGTNVTVAYDDTVGTMTVNATVPAVNAINNQYTSAQTADYWISGKARVEDQTTVGGKTDQTQLIVKAAATQAPSRPYMQFQKSDGSAMIDIRGANDGSIAFGSAAFENLTTGSWNTAMGNGTLRNITTGSSNTAVGFNTMVSSTTAVGNVTLGMNALMDNVANNYNTAVGFGAALHTKGDRNTAIGTGALESNITGGENTAVGESALSSALSDWNVGVGKGAANTVTTGWRNTAVGTWSLQHTTTGNFNTAIGNLAGTQDYGTDSYNGAFKTLPDINHSTAIGAHAQVQASSSIVLGSVDVPMKVGIGTTIPLNTVSVSPLNHKDGTAQVDAAGKAVIGVGTTWTTTMVGMQFIFANGQMSTIEAVADNTHLTLVNSQPITTAQAYRIHNLGLQVANDGRVAIGKSTPAVGSNLDVSGAVSASSYLYGGQPEWTTVPATATSAGVTGQKAIDANYLYFCTAPNTWARVARSAW